MRGMRDMTHGELVWKPWRIQCTSQAALARFRCLRCTHGVRHEPLVNSRASSYYRVAKRFVKELCSKRIKDEDVICGFYHSGDVDLDGVDVFSEFSASKSTFQSFQHFDIFPASVDDMVLVASKFLAAEPTEKEKLRVMHNLERIQANAGRPANPVLATRLRQDGAPLWVQKLALELV